MNRGEIWNYEFKSPDKKRPVLILTRDEVIPHLHSITIAPITRTIRGVPSEVLIGPQEGLKETSAINLHHVMTVPRSSLRQFAGSLSADKMQEVKEAMLFALGFEE